MFYAIGNIGDSKKSDKSRLTDPNDRYECIVEIMDVELPLSDFPRGNVAISTLESEKFDEKGTYGWRYIWKSGTDEEKAEVFNYCKQKWIDFYKFVVNSTDAEFYANLKDYFVIDSALFYYLFTTRYTMVDNRSKNTFWHYGWTGEYDAQGNKVRKWDLSFNYDNDTSLGINNYGDMVYRHGLEDTDVDENGTEVFRESDNTFFCRLRDLFHKELKEMYNTLESQNAWSADGLINQFDTWQNEFPEELWRVDIERKYIRTYTSTFINGAGDAQFLRDMAHGKKKYQRRQYERAQERYMASKYQSTLAASDHMVLRCTVPTGNLVVRPNYKLKLTPFDYMYLNVKYGTQDPIQVRGIPGVEYEIPFTENAADIVDIYSISAIQSVGNLAPCYPATLTVASDYDLRIKELILGSNIKGYDNPSFSTLSLGAMSLLETLNIENVSGLTQSLNLSALANLRELYAKGSNIGGVTFANGGLMEIAELPAVNSITMRNLMYLSKLDIVSFDRLTNLIIENCNKIDLVSILQEASNVNRVRLTGVNWTLNDTSLLETIYNMAGIDKNGYNVSQSVLTGTVYVPAIGQQELYKFQRAWSDLEIKYTTLIAQFTVTFVNTDGEVLDIQYINIGEKAVDPIHRAENPIRIPQQESTVQYNYTFAGWDLSLDNVFSDRVITAIYTPIVRTYTIKYMSKGTILQETVAHYGDIVMYKGDIPTYTAEEPGYVYYLFNRWDKSGIVHGDKTVNAIYDTCVYRDGYFDGKELKDLTPVEIYAMTKVGISHEVITDKDQCFIPIGHDYNFDDMESITFIDEETKFNGATDYLDTGISLFEEDKDFVFVIDYKINSGNVNGATLCQCYHDNGSTGFKLHYNSSPKFTWVNQTFTTASVGIRNLLVIRHKKGDMNLTVYRADSLTNMQPTITTLKASKETFGDNHLVFGCARADDGVYENFCLGTIYWAKLWYGDLGDELCNNLAMWTHQIMPMEACGTRRYYLADNSNQRCSFTLLASYLLDQQAVMNKDNTNLGGFKSSTLCEWLNTRLYKAFPDQIRSLLKQVKIPSTAGGTSIEIDYAHCYVSVPSYIEMVATTGDALIYEGETISYMTSNEERVRSFLTTSMSTTGNTSNQNRSYWYRSPYSGNSTAFWYFYAYYNATTGSHNYNATATNGSTGNLGVLIMISF